MPAYDLSGSEVIQVVAVTGWGRKEKTSVAETGFFVFEKKSFIIRVIHVFHSSRYHRKMTHREEVQFAIKPGIVHNPLSSKT